ncbi:MAG: DUF362 domain-containing protein [Bacteroidetes bacterium]|nr:DUF362 domain-containing protein [Bacteroidota bacterium]
MKKLSLLVVALLLLSLSLVAKAPDIVVVKGEGIYENTLFAVEKMGGMQRFVQPGQKVGLLVNSDFKEYGAYVNPDIVIAVLKMIFDAGVSDVVFLQPVSEEYWKKSNLAESHWDIISKTRGIDANKFPAQFSEEYFVKIENVENAKAINFELEIVKEFFDVDVFINIPIAKHHATTVLTNAMKNLMGLNTRASNVKFHLNGPSRNDPDFIAQCIVDLNLLRKADLIISDMTNVIKTNGPGGPGEIISPMKIVAGRDAVAIDKYCAQELGFFIEDVLTVQKGFEAGLGKIDLNQLNIVEFEN